MPREPHHEKERFPTTHWTLIRKACADDGTERDLDALEKVCLSYWYPLYAWARHSGWREDDAKDLIQSFFEELLAKHLLVRADPMRGRLRTFLLTCLKRHAGNLTDKANAAKRDVRKTISLDFEWAEGRYHDHQLPSDSPDKLYDRRWARSLLQRALNALRDEMNAEGKLADYEILKPFLGFQPDELGSYRDAATRLGIGEAAVKSRVFRLRKRYHEMLTHQAAMTLGPDCAVKDELMNLMGAL